MADVLVIGGGPCGTSFSARMAMLGHRVTLVERTRFPRRHVGESLSPGVAPLLASFGAEAVMADSGGSAVDAVLTHWDGPPTVRHDPRAEGMIVDRSWFDRLLLDHARSLGVDIRQPASVVRLAHHAGHWQADIREECGTTRHRADFLVHATGRGQGGRAGHAGGSAVRTIALHGWWRGRGLSTMPRIIAGERGWFWGVPLPDGTSSLLAFVDARAFRSRADHDGATLQQRYHMLLAGSGLLDGASSPEQIGPTQAIDASPLLHPDPISDRQMRIGDAAMALDPLSSSGVQKAIQNAMSGAIVANTLLEGGDQQAAIRFHRTNLADAAARHARWAAGHYARAATTRPDRFWQDRAQGAMPDAPAPPAANAPDLKQPVALSPDARLVATPCLDETRIVCRPALCHPGLDGPVAFLGGVELAPLLAGVRPGLTPLALAHGWADRMPLTKSLAIAGWLVNNDVLVALARVGCARPPEMSTNRATAGERAGVVA